MVLEVLMWLVVGAGVLFVLLLLLAVVAEIVLVIRKRGRRTAESGGADPPPAPPSWKLSLLVDVVERGGQFYPSIQLRGSPVRGGATIRLELVDRSGATRAVTSRSLPPGAIGAELMLPAFAAPDGVRVEQVLTWHWDVVISDGHGELARWREHPGLAGELNAEAEIEIPRVRRQPSELGERERRLIEAVLGVASSSDLRSL